MNLIKAKNEYDLSVKASSIIASNIIEKNDINLGLATGSTPLLTYKRLIKLYEEGVLDFSKVKGFNLDEYVGIEKTHYASYAYQMKENFYRHINIKEENTFIPDGMSENLEKESRDYEDKIEKSGGIDLQIVGMGSNGHIAFNEPDEKFANETRIVSLTKETLKDNARFFKESDKVPKEAITMGIRTIMKAKKILMICYGEQKRNAFMKMIHGDVDPKLPASILQYHHNVVVIYVGY